MIAMEETAETAETVVIQGAVHLVVEVALHVVVGETIHPERMIVVIGTETEIATTTDVTVTVTAHEVLMAIVKWKTPVIHETRIETVEPMAMTAKVMLNTRTPGYMLICNSLSAP